MDFIERIFGIAPDGGSGLFELLLFLLPVAGIIALRLKRKHRVWHRHLQYAFQLFLTKFCCFESLWDQDCAVESFGKGSAVRFHTLLP
jgi:hypothetical protein